MAKPLFYRRKRETFNHQASGLNPGASTELPWSLAILLAHAGAARITRGLVGFVNGDVRGARIHPIDIRS